MKQALKILHTRYKEVGLLGVLKLFYLRIRYIIWERPKAKRTVKAAEMSYKTHKILRWFLRNVSRVVYFSKRTKNKECRILVVLHMFYDESVDEVIEYLKNLKGYKYDLVVTYMEGHFSARTLETIKHFKKNTTFKKCKNIGYDIGPFIDVINGVNLSEYDIVMKLQTKGTRRDVFVYDQFFRNRDWFLNLWDGVLGCFSVHKTVDKLYNNKRIGLVAAKNLIVHDPLHKQQLTKQRLSQSGIRYVDNYYFVAGSCFAVKSKCLQDVQSYKIKLSDFEESGQGFFSFAHVMERYVCFCCMPKYEAFGNKVDRWRHLKWFRAEKTLRSMAALNMIHSLGDYDISPDYAWLVLEQCYLKKIEQVKLRLGDIKREHPQSKEIINLDECEPYLYLLGGKKHINEYKEYCNYHQKDKRLPNMSLDRFEDLVNSIKKNGYKKKYPILVDEKNVICDGQHRACVLLYLHDEDFEIPVLRLHFLKIDPGRIRRFSRKVPLMPD